MVMGDLSAKFWNKKRKRDFQLVEGSSSTFFSHLSIHFETLSSITLTTKIMMGSKVEKDLATHQGGPPLSI
jgi:hypothetical protein